MADCGEAPALRYSAFISYSHRDAAFARRLHRRLETYRLPRRLAGGTLVTPAGRLRPIFRDRDELAAAADLTDAVQGALAESGALIVICSQAAAASEWVGREVAAFRRAHGGGVVLAALIDGDEATAFPAALHTVGPGGRKVEPLAADFRDSGDGRRLALLKLVAVLAGVRLADLVQRDAQRRIRQITVAAGAAALGMAAMTVLTFVAVNARSAAERERNRGEALIDFMLTDLRGKLKGVGRLDVLDAVNQGALAYYSGQDLSHLSVAALEQRARLLQAMGEDDKKRGKFEEARKKFAEARRTTRALLEADPKNEKRIYDHAQSEFWVGYMSWTMNDSAGAQKAFEAYAALATRLVASSPDNLDWQMELAEANNNLGSLVLRHSLALDEARRDLVIAQHYYEAVAQRRPDDDDLNDEIAVTDAWLADVERLSGHFDKALALRGQQRDILAGMLARDQRNAETREALAANKLAFARIYMAQGSFDQALSFITEGETRDRELANADQENVDLKRQVRVYSLFRAEALMAEPKRSANVDTIKLVLGDCKQDRKLPGNAEEFAFCSILDARLARLSGDAARAKRLVQAIQAERPAGADALTPIWGLNLADEMHRALGE